MVGSSLRFCKNLEVRAVCGLCFCSCWFTEFSKTVFPPCLSQNLFCERATQSDRDNPDARRELQMFLSCKQQLYHRPIFSFWHPGAFPRDEEEGREEAASGGILHGAEAAPTHFEGMRPREEGEGLGSFPGAAEISRSQGEAGQRAALFYRHQSSHTQPRYLWKSGLKNQVSISCHMTV